MAHARQDLRIRIPSISCVSQGAIVEEGLGGGGGGGGGSGGGRLRLGGVCPPPMKGVWCSGCHRPRINQGVPLRWA